MKGQTTEKLNSFIESLENYIVEFEHILTDISFKLPEIENQIDKNVIKARELLDFIFSKKVGESGSGVKHELEEFQKQMNIALETLSISEQDDAIIFEELKDTIEISNDAIKRINEIYNISENLKVFAINSIIYSQKEGVKGKGYQIISGKFINLSEEITKCTTIINEIGNRMNDEIEVFLKRIKVHEEFTHDHILAISRDSLKLIENSNKSVENFSTVLNDLLNRVDSIKDPTYQIMVQIQKQDIIQQQMSHLMEIVNDILLLMKDNSYTLNLDITLNIDEKEKNEFLNLASLLNFLLITTEKQMARINKELLDMINRMEIEFKKIYTAIDDVNNDKNLISQLVIPEKDSIKKGSVIHLIFEAPNQTIIKILDNLEIGQKQKKGIINVFKVINSLVLSEKKTTKAFIPIIESINNLLLLARIEKARNNLNVSDDLGTEKGQISQSAFSELAKIIKDLDDSEMMIGQNLNKTEEVFIAQNLKYKKMNSKLTESLSILKVTENIFTENYLSVMQISDTLSGELVEYTKLFDKLRDLNKKMDKEILICTNLRIEMEKKLNILGGAVNLNQSYFKETIIKKIVERLTVEEERTSISEEFSELNIEKSTGYSITLF